MEPDAEAWLARAGYDPDFGARPLRRVLQRQIEDPLALALLEGRYLEGSTVTVKVVDDKIVLGLTGCRHGARRPAASALGPCRAAGLVEDGLDRRRPIAGDAHVAAEAEVPAELPSKGASPKLKMPPSEATSQ